MWKSEDSCQKSVLSIMWVRRYTKLAQERKVFKSINTRSQGQSQTYKTDPSCPETRLPALRLSAASEYGISMPLLHAGLCGPSVWSFCSVQHLDTVKLSH